MIRFELPTSSLKALKEYIGTVFAVRGTYPLTKWYEGSRRGEENGRCAIIVGKKETREGDGEFCVIHVMAIMETNT